MKPFRGYKNGTKKILSPEELVTSRHEWTCTMFQNSIAWQLGDQQHCEARNTSLSNGELLARAKQTIMDAEFVGFYETLQEDFWRLKQTFFRDVSVPFYIPLAFWFATVIASPRLVSLKYTSELSKPQMKVMMEQNALDIQLWEWARARYRPNLVLYPNYEAWMRDHTLDLLAAAAVSLALLACCCTCFVVICRCCCKMCCGASSSTPKFL